MLSEARTESLLVIKLLAAVDLSTLQGLTEKPLAAVLSSGALGEDMAHTERPLVLSGTFLAYEIVAGCFVPPVAWTEVILVTADLPFSLPSTHPSQFMAWGFPNWITSSKLRSHFPVCAPVQQTKSLQTCEAFSLAPVRKRRSARQMLKRGQRCHKASVARWSMIMPLDRRPAAPVAEGGRARETRCWSAFYM